MIEVKIKVDSPRNLLNMIGDLNNDLKSSGYKQGVDYDFEYIPKPVEWSGDVEYNYHQLSFRFYKESLATYFKLKYG